MCLDSITRTQEPDDTVLEGWKVFNPESLPQSLVYDHCFELDEWNKVPQHSDERIYVPYTAFYDLSYPAGFHIFESPEACKAWAVPRGWDNCSQICKVKLRKIHTVGEQDGLDVHVGEEIFISSEDWQQRTMIALAEGE